MKAKLIKDHQEYMLINNERFVIATTDKSILEVTDKMKLSKQNCDEIFGVVDVEKLADELKVGISYKEYDHLIKRGIIVGFNKAMELNNDKLFTLEDMIRMSEFVKIITQTEPHITIKKLVSSYVQSLQQPTEIEVEIVMGYVGECGGNNGDGCFQDSPGHDCGCFEYIPKLDDNGCLILKKL